MVNTTIKNILSETGTTQAWIISKMNQLNPDLAMNSNKFSAIVHGRRKMTGEELIIFCKATKTNPDIFLR